MSIELLERAVVGLGPLAAEVMFVGGATVSLWITDPAAPPPRPTKDVDVVVGIFTRADLHAFEERLRATGLREDRESGVICRWRAGSGGLDDLILDVMPAEATLMGFANRWQVAALPHALEKRLPSGTTLQVIAPPFLLATKIEAFRGRGHGDHLVSRDLEDVVTLVDGRAEIVDDARRAPEDVREFLAAEVGALLNDDGFRRALPGFLRPDAASQARLAEVVVPRLQALAEGAPEPFPAE